MHARSLNFLLFLRIIKITLPNTEPKADVLIFDGSAFVNVVTPRKSKTFEVFVITEILPILEAYSSKYKIIDIVFYVYMDSSLKAEARLKRGKGARRRVTGNGKIPLFCETIRTRPNCFTLLPTR